MKLLTAAERVGITYRQANYWSERGFIKTRWEDRHGEGVDAQFAGTGYSQMIDYAEVRVLRLMTHLVHGGLKPEPASKYARQLLGGRPVRIGPLRLDYAEHER